MYALLTVVLTINIGAVSFITSAAELKKLNVVPAEFCGASEKLSAASRRMETSSGAEEGLTPRRGAWRRSLAPATIVLLHGLSFLILLP